MIGWIADTQSNGRHAGRHRQDKLFWPPGVNASPAPAGRGRLISDCPIVTVSIIRLLNSWQRVALGGDNPEGFAMTPLPQTATRLSRLLLSMLYRILRSRIVAKPRHHASQVASTIAADGNPLGV
ncbi:hypothetical protein AB7M49_005472 [Bradyrhizobium elkanii]